LLKKLKGIFRTTNNIEIKQECCVCRHSTPHKLIHKHTEKEYPYCLSCRTKYPHNEDNFYVRDYRESH
jgi:hypothetical protein